jgi:hypothetical protein
MNNTCLPQVVENCLCLPRIFVALDFRFCFVSLLMPSIFHRARIEDSTQVDIDSVLPDECLHHFATPGIIPPSARVDPKLKIQPRQPLRIWDIWKYGVVAVAKGDYDASFYQMSSFIPCLATEVTGDVLSHHVWGPRKKSWGIEMTIVSSLMRGAGRHSTLVDIVSRACFIFPALLIFFKRLLSECS